MTIKLALQLAGWLPFDPGTMIRVRDFDLAKTQAAHMAGDVAGLLRECRATAWTQLQQAIPGQDSEHLFHWLVRLEMAIRVHFIVARRVGREVLTIIARPSPVMAQLARMGVMGLWLTKRMAWLEAPVQVMLIHWKIFKQIRQAS